MPNWAHRSDFNLRPHGSVPAVKTSSGVSGSAPQVAELSSTRRFKWWTEDRAQWKRHAQQTRSASRLVLEIGFYSFDHQPRTCHQALSGSLHEGG